MTTATIAHLRVKLDDFEPAVMRRLEVPLTIRLDRLHLVLQAAIGWTNSHLYEIRARDVGWGMLDPDFGDGPLDAAKARLVDALEDVGSRSLKYLGSGKILVGQGATWSGEIAPSRPSRTAALTTATR
jgi:hypothetical protein